MNHRGSRIDDGVAIVGMACRLPGAPDLDSFWRLLADGREALTHFSEAELRASGVDPAVLNDPAYVRAGMILDDIDAFDAHFFGVAAHDAAVMDPQQRLLLECAWHALEDAGGRAVRSDARVGVYAGGRISDYLLFYQDPPDVFGHVEPSPLEGLRRITLNDKDYLATRVAYILDLRGPAVTVQTACSTSLVAAHLACQALLRGECDAALAGGVSIRVPHNVGYKFAEGLIFSPDGHTRPFDASASGPIVGSGVGVVVLRRLDDALASGDRIYAVIRGSAINNDGAENKAAFTGPSLEGQRRVVADALAVADVDPATISYVEAHGTSTRVGDPVEVGALAAAFGPRDSASPCAIGSVKSNIGHLFQAAGVSGLIKTALMLHHRTLVPSINFAEPNPLIDFEGSGFRVNTDRREWASLAAPRRAGVSAFGFGGTNAHLVLEEAPPEAPAESRCAGNSPPCLLPISAKSSAALRAMAERLMTFLDNAADASAEDICATAQARPRHFAQRLAVVGSSKGALRAQLRARLSEMNGANDRLSADRRRVVFLFTGQGAQYAGMGRRLYETESVFRETIDRCATVVAGEIDTPLRDALYGPEAAHRLSTTEYAQPALFATEAALATLWRSWGVEPRVVLGHSLGELCAAWIAGVFSLDDAMRLAVVRGRLMQRAPSGRMAAVFAPHDLVAPLVNAETGRITIAAVNGREQTIVAGEHEVVDRVLRACEDHGFAGYHLPGDVAFHSCLMDPVLREFESAVERVRMRSPAADTFISTVTGTFAGPEVASSDYWRRQARETVQFASAISTAIDAGCDVLIEIGPDPVLTRLGRAAHPEGDVLWCTSLRRGADDLEECLSALGAVYARGVDVNWPGVSAPSRVVSLPPYPFERTRFWIDRATTPRVVARHDGAHPLLGGRMPSPLADVQFQSQLTADVAPFARDHWIFGTRPLMLVGQLEMARAAAADVLACQSESIVLENVVVERPLLLDEAPRQVQTVVTCRADRTADVRIFSAAAGSHRWQCHSTLRARLAPRATSVRCLDIAAIKARCPNTMTGAEIHTRKHAKGAPIGAGLEIVPLAWRGAGEVLAEAVLREVDRDDAARYDAYPGVMDAVPQCAELTFPDASPSTRTALFLPTVAERVEFSGRVPDRAWAHVRLRDGFDDEVYGVDADIADEAGRIVFEVRGLFFKRATPLALRVDDDPPAQTHEIVWTPMESPAADAIVAGTWVMLGDGGSLAHRVANRLQARGAQCIVASDEQMQDESVSHILARAPHGSSRAILDLRSLGWVVPDMDPLEMARVTCGRTLSLVQRMLSEGIDAPYCIVTRGGQTTGHETAPVVPGQAALWGFGRTLQREQPALPCRLIDLDPAGDDDLDAVIAAIADATGETEIAVRGPATYAIRLRPVPPPADHSPAPYTFRPSAARTLHDLSPSPLTRRAPGPGEVEIEVFASGLNFRDVLNATGRVEGPLGYECSGRVTALGPGVTHLHVGMTVMALAPHGLSSHVTLDACFVVEAPSHLSFVAAAATPLAYLTVYYALVECASLSAGQSVVVHTAAGGVGLAAIHIAHAVGARVFATASRRKWSFVRAQGVEHVMDSRTPGYSADVLRLTGGAGADVLLNTLGPDFTDDHLKALRPGGRFIELGHPGVHDVSRTAARAAARGIEFITFHIAADVDRHRILTILQTLSTWMSAGRIRPLPCRQFPVTDVRDAFETMLRARHVGKLVAVHPSAARADRHLVRAAATYVITGGTGAVGLRIAEHLVTAGARHVVLLARRPPSDSARAAIAGLEQLGAAVTVESVDIADAAALQAVIDRVRRTCPRLAGIIHAAGITDDGVIAHQSWERFAAVLSPKIAGAWNLMRLTSGTPLDFFVVIASSAGLLGNAGQASYAAANAWLDQFAHFGRQRGIPVTSVDFGLIGGSGMGESLSPAARERHRARGIGGLDPDRAIDLMLASIAADRPQAAVLAIDWNAYVSQFDGATPSTVRGFARVRREAPSVRHDPPARERPATLDQTFDRIRPHIAALAGHGRAVDVNRTLPELGLDSLTVLLLRGRLVADLGAEHTPPVVAFLARHTVADLAAMIFERACPEATVVPTAAAPAVLPETPQRCLTLLKSAGVRQPLFLIPPAGRSVVPLLPLARAIDADCPVYGFNPLGFDGESGAHWRVEDMAAHYVEELQRECPHGPYVLAGMCFGGIVAWEMAQQLRTRGADVAMLFGIDAGTPLLNLSVLSARDLWRFCLQRMIHHLSHGSLLSALGAIGKRHRIALDGRFRLRHRIEQGAGTAAGSVESVHRVHRVAAANYRASRAPFRVVVLRSGDYARTAVHRWRLLAEGGVEIVTFDGTSHLELLSERSAVTLAAAISARLRALAEP